MGMPDAKKSWHILVCLSCMLPSPVDVMANGFVSHEMFLTILQNQTRLAILATVPKAS
jgi:hypothetical protein